MFTAVVLDEDSRSRLEKSFSDFIPEGWKIYCHHMTINLGKIEKGPLTKISANPREELLGTRATLLVDKVAKDEMVMAVGVSTNIPSKNKEPHITVAVNTLEGGKPRMSNDLKAWKKLNASLVLFGTIQEVM